MALEEIQGATIGSDVFGGLAILHGFYVNVVCILASAKDKHVLSAAYGCPDEPSTICSIKDDRIHEDLFVLRGVVPQWP
jgi:hypothetical protein